MKILKYSIYMLSLIILPVTNSIAGVEEEERQLSNTMFVFIGIAAVALLATYLLWKMNESRKKQNVSNTNNNRGPIKRPLMAYQRRKAT